jgi:hypothetical protein
MGGDAMKIDQLIPPHMLATIRDQIVMDRLTRVSHKQRLGEYVFGGRDATKTSIYLAHLHGKELDFEERY